MSVQDLLVGWIRAVGKREHKNRVEVFALSTWTNEVPFTELLNPGQGTDLGEKQQGFLSFWTGQV